MYGVGGIFDSLGFNGLIAVDKEFDLWGFMTGRCGSELAESQWI